MIVKICNFCKHPEKSHLSKGGKRQIIIFAEMGKHWCEGCGRDKLVGVPKAFHTFELDNLSYIEDLAKKRKLI